MASLVGAMQQGRMQGAEPSHAPFPKLYIPFRRNFDFRPDPQFAGAAFTAVAPAVVAAVCSSNIVLALEDVVVTRAVIHSFSIPTVLPKMTKTKIAHVE